MDLEPGQEDLILQGAPHVVGLAADGVKTGVYCQAGIFRTSTVAIAHLMVRGRSLDAASRIVRAVRPQAMSALEPWRSLDTSKAS